MISLRIYELVALEDSDAVWELDRGHLRSKPGGTIEQNCVLSALHRRLILQLERHDWSVGTNTCRLCVSANTYFVPDLCVIPREFVQRKLREMPDRLEVYDEPLPLVVEVWSAPIGDYDVEEKLREYQLLGDVEIWRVHPYERTLTAWRRQPDGAYTETVLRGGAVQPAALPGVTIQLEQLFD